jgi:hypothetical protein
MGTAYSIRVIGKQYIQCLGSSREGNKFLENFDVDTMMILKRNTRE